jgi:hypothetical protein
MTLLVDSRGAGEWLATHRAGQQQRTMAGIGDLLNGNLATGLAELSRATGGEADPATLAPAGLPTMTPVQPIRGQALAPPATLLWHVLATMPSPCPFVAGPRRAGTAARVC